MQRPLFEIYLIPVEGDRQVSVSRNVKQEFDDPKKQCCLEKLWEQLERLVEDDDQ